MFDKTNGGAVPGNRAAARSPVAGRRDGGGGKQKDIPYIVFDSIAYEKNTPSYRYIAKFNNNELKIGRGIDMDLIMNDLSISRNHCHLELNENGEVLLNDSNSKFGTLILVQTKKIEILDSQTLTIQVGRTFFNILYRKNNSLFSCCHAEEIDLTKSYEKLFRHWFPAPFAFTAVICRSYGPPLIMFTALFHNGFHY